ncbi:hypothetical protein DyAD56_15455 [Dyella sp. AD56]|nr:hypothetical protein DyAD56_15455 [Dyella sp. AD56]
MSDRNALAQLHLVVGPDIAAAGNIQCAARTQIDRTGTILARSGQRLLGGEGDRSAIDVSVTDQLIRIATGVVDPKTSCAQYAVRTDGDVAVVRHIGRQQGQRSPWERNRRRTDGRDGYTSRGSTQRAKHVDMRPREGDASTRHHAELRAGLLDNLAGGIGCRSDKTHMGKARSAHHVGRHRQPEARVVATGGRQQGLPRRAGIEAGHLVVEQLRGLLQRYASPIVGPVVVRSARSIQIERAAIRLLALPDLIPSREGLSRHLPIHGEGSARLHAELARVAPHDEARIPATHAGQQGVVVILRDTPAGMVDPKVAREAHKVHVGIGVGDVIDPAVGSQQVGRRHPAGLISEITAIKVQLRPAPHDHFRTIERDVAALGHHLCDVARHVLHIAGDIENGAAHPVEPVRTRTTLRAVDQHVLLCIQKAVA